MLFIQEYLTVTVVTVIFLMASSLNSSCSDRGVNSIFTCTRLLHKNPILLGYTLFKLEFNTLVLCNHSKIIVLFCPNVREGSARGFGIRTSQSTYGSDSWGDDPITRHIISLSIDKNTGESFLLWPLVLHIKGYFHVLVLPLVEPRHLEAYEKICHQSDERNSSGDEETLSSLLLDLPSITGYGKLLAIYFCVYTI